MPGQVDFGQQTSAFKSVNLRPAKSGLTLTFAQHQMWVAHVGEGSFVTG